MITGNQRSVNVDRIKLIAILKTNLEKHQVEYLEALALYRKRLAEDLKLASEKVPTMTDDEALRFTFNLPAPHNYSNMFKEVIDMLEWSVDQNISLDQQSFAQYVKNEWHWRAHFNESMRTYAMAGSSWSS